MSSAPLVTSTGIELLLRKTAQTLPWEYQKDFELAVYNPIDHRLIGNVWSLKWDGRQAFLI